RSFWNGPAEQNAVEFQAEIVMQMRSLMFLNDKAQSLVTGRNCLPDRLRCHIEITLLVVAFDRHVECQALLRAGDFFDAADFLGAALRGLPLFEELVAALDFLRVFFAAGFLLDFADSSGFSFVLSCTR